MTTRRQFIRGALTMTAAYAVGATGVALLTEPPKPELTAEQKHRLISEYIKTAAGREKLAASMVQPIRTRLEYDKAGRPLPTYYSPTLDPDFLSLPTKESLARPLNHYPSVRKPPADR